MRSSWPARSSSPARGRQPSAAWSSNRIRPSARTGLPLALPPELSDIPGVTESPDGVRYTEAAVFVTGRWNGSEFVVNRVDTDPAGTEEPAGS